MNPRSTAALPRTFATMTVQKDDYYLTTSNDRTSIVVHVDDVELGHVERFGVQFRATQLDADDVTTYVRRFSTLPTAIGFILNDVTLFDPLTIDGFLRDDDRPDPKGALR